MAEITERMQELARELFAESIAAGNDYTKATHQARSWSLDGEEHLQIFAVDGENKSALWKEGE